MSNRKYNPWLPLRKPRPEAHVRLFCFPYAGGGALVFQRWMESFPAWVEVCPVQLPGRGQRLHEPRVTRMALLVDCLRTAFSEQLDKPFAFFGHSMGAIVSFELARGLYSERCVQPIHLFASGCSAPQILRSRAATYKLPQQDFVQRLFELDGTPREVLEDQELLQLLLPLLRSDFELIETYDYLHKSKLSCPITAMGGITDKDIRREDLEAWREQSSGAFRIFMLPGNHFFLHNEERQVIRLITMQLEHTVTQRDEFSSIRLQGKQSLVY